MIVDSIRRLKTWRHHPVIDFRIYMLVANFICWVFSSNITPCIWLYSAKLTELYSEHIKLWRANMIWIPSYVSFWLQVIIIRCFRKGVPCYQFETLTNCPWCQMQWFLLWTRQFLCLYVYMFSCTDAQLPMDVSNNGHLIFTLILCVFTTTVYFLNVRKEQVRLHRLVCDRNISNKNTLI